MQQEDHPVSNPVSTMGISYDSHGAFNAFLFVLLHVVDMLRTCCGHVACCNTNGESDSVKRRFVRIGEAKNYYSAVHINFILPLMRFLDV